MAEIQLFQPAFILRAVGIIYLSALLVSYIGKYNKFFLIIIISYKTTVEILYLRRY